MSKKNSDLVTLIGQVNQLNLILEDMGECISRLSETIKESRTGFTLSYPMFCNKTKYITWLGEMCYTLGYHARDLEGYGQQLEKEFEEGENQ